MRSESRRRSFDLKVERFRSREAGRATTIVLAVLALAAIGGLAFALMKIATPEKIEQARGRAADDSWQAGAIEEAEPDPRSPSSARESRRAMASGSTPSSEDRTDRDERSDHGSTPSVVTREEGSRPNRRSRPRGVVTDSDRDAPRFQQRDDSLLGLLRKAASESLTESSPEAVSDRVRKGDLFEQEFLDGDAANNWGYDELPARFANQAGLEDGFLVVGFDGEFVHGQEALQAKASRPNQPNPVPIDVWNPWTGEQATVMLPLESLRFSESPE